TAAMHIEQRYGKKEGQWIGIAPFAKYRSNMLPYRVTKEIIQRMSNQPNTRVFLFGAGEIECEMLRQWASVFQHTESIAGRLQLSEELELMRQLDVMICMDSANQHLSSLVNLRAVSVWCATHPIIGFKGWKQSEENIIQVNDLRCRPCTCHGTNYCKYGNFACRQINAETIIKHI
ncbi:MAG: glycosyltransferase family 9 protein, partial [Paludibacteraceae bacterium]|nr:glycosyltransferase family 9 protein [Paludibacteraceae bacterium]